MNKLFPMQKVLDFRLKALDREKAKLGDLVNEYRMMLSRMAEIAKEIKVKEDEQEAESKAGHFDFTDLYKKYISVLERDFHFIESKRNELLAKIEEQKKVLQTALSDVKIMEKLKEKHLLSYAQYMRKQEELQIDEINITKQKDETL